MVLDVLSPYGPFDDEDEAMIWLADIDTWEPPDSPSSPEVLWLERYVLGFFFVSTNGNAWKNKSGWLSASSICNGWFGVTCNPSGSVQAIVSGES